MWGWMGDVGGGGGEGWKFSNLRVGNLVASSLERSPMGGVVGLWFLLHAFTLDYPTTPPQSQWRPLFQVCSQLDFRVGYN